MKEISIETLLTNLTINIYELDKIMIKFGYYSNISEDDTINNFTINNFTMLNSFDGVSLYTNKETNEFIEIYFNYRKTTNNIYIYEVII